MATEPNNTDQPKAQPQAPVENRKEDKAISFKLKVTAGAGAPPLVAGIHFPEGKTKTITVTPERAALIHRAPGLKVEEIK